MNAPKCFMDAEPAVAIWLHQNQLDYGQPGMPLCQKSLDYWFDNADDAPELEPVQVLWLDGSRVLGEVPVR